MLFKITIICVIFGHCSADIVDWYRKGISKFENTTCYSCIYEPENTLPVAIIHGFNDQCQDNLQINELIQSIHENVKVEPPIYAECVDIGNKFTSIFTGLRDQAEQYCKKI